MPSPRNEKPKISKKRETVMITGGDTSGRHTVKSTQLVVAGGYYMEWGSMRNAREMSPREMGIW